MDLYEKGASLNEVARLVGKSKSYVRRILHEAGYQTSIKISEKAYTSWRKGGRGRAHAPFGYTYHLGALVSEPRESQILMLIKELVRSGKKPREIAGYLNSHKMKPRRAKLWQVNTVAKILARLAK